MVKEPPLLWLPTHKSTLIVPIERLIYSMEKWSLKTYVRCVVLSNYFKIVLRSLISHRLYSAINIMGLAIGLACCILMALFVSYELSYDIQYNKSDKVARLHMSQASTAGMDRWPRAGAGWKLLLEDAYPEIVRVGRINLGQVQMKIDELSVSERIMFADQEIFDIFEFEFLRGNAATAFEDVHSVVLTESSAKRLFGDSDPMGKSIAFYHSFDMKVTGIVKDFPENTHLPNYSFANLKATPELFGVETFLTNQFNMNFYTYLEFSSFEGIKKLEEQLPELIEKNFGALLNKFNIQLFAELMPLEKLHLHSRIAGDLKDTGDINQVYIFSAIAILVLIIACINFMNLATARAAQRAKEVGVRKAIGVQRRQITIQFLSESIILSCIALVIAIALVELTLPIFSEFISRDLVFNYFSNISLFFSLLGLALFVGLLAGSYPAFYLSAFSPAKVLKGDVTRGRSGAKFRQGLVVFQFSIAAILIISTITIYQQMQYAKNIDLGYEKDQTLVINGTGSGVVQENFASLEQQMGSIPGVKWISSVRRLPGQRLTNNTTVKAPGQEQLIMPYNGVDYEFFQNFGIALESGRYFSEEFANDTLVYQTDENPVTKGNVILNQTAAKRFGWTAQEAIGKVLEFNANQDGSSKIDATVIGVVKDYHFESVREELKPIIHFVNQSQQYMMTLKLETSDIPNLLLQVEERWEKLFPTQDISYFFLDERFDSMYANEERVSLAYGIFSLLAICIACLGLFGLASYTTEQRTKEIGVRKVLGASSRSIVLLLTKEFSKLVILASLFAWPIAWYLMDDWLQNFAYRIDLSILVFFGGTLVALFIAWITVAGQATKAAVARPVNALRYE
ncbi:FtsX-like permease family protein [Aliikangiella coralliicola]|uniref:FtsX-like permease family protein n=2 Tax=Aliikangiella coralliicola TaxID=2592383 RepID=A0A545UIS8_9GAMM|nr:FtsX-like permease family protein [Aliikangiella coralliicola]